MNIDRIFYLTPNNQKPCGGVLINYLHCYFLQKNGYNAFPLTTYEEPLSWFDHSIPHKTIKEVGTRLNKNDIVVASEVFPYGGLRFKNAYKIMFAQNWQTIHHDYPQPKWYNYKKRRNKYNRAGLRKNHNSYKDLGYNEIISVSDYVTDYIQETMNLPAYTIPNGIDLNKFTYNPNKREKNKVLCLPRKNHHDIQKIKELVMKKIDPQSISWEIVHDIPQEQLINKYHECDIFLSTGYPEGFGLPHLEAMACGCLVVGFTGGGANMFMKNKENSLIASDGDCETAATLLLNILKDENIHKKEKMRKNGIEMASHFSLEMMEKKVLKYYEQLEKA
jgi:glycosyltransferase involved in cell wall biosynthesis